MQQCESGGRVDKDEVRGTVTDLITNIRKKIIASYTRCILGMTVNQLVHAGFAAYNIDIQQLATEATHPPRPLLKSSIRRPDLARSAQSK